MEVSDKAFTKEYLNNLLEFSKFITYRSELPPSRENQLYTFFSNLKGELTSTLKQMKRQNSQVDCKISISPNIIFRYDNPVGKDRKFHVSIGGILKIENSLIVEQSLCVNLILEHTSNSENIPNEWKMYPAKEGFHILRKFHFDFDSKNDDDSKPKFHLQYGGSFKEKYLKIDGNIHYKLYSQLDTPRLPQQPYDIIILLDFMLREFELEGCEIAKESRWNEIVIKSEKLWLKPYYENLLTRLNCSTRISPLHRIQ
ncbi:hypothetical protein [Photobacterium damselae]|uniref:Uncharacterized protein n=1 Tax=Photobacterium damselae TaxID=38293 RepID=A0ABD6X783_PHODM|nr:hypothetical protein [Photobacterium damselae]OBU43760.1 hypothetical protein AYY27_03965 [Photobacterium damselae]PSU18647.1 hypothetical protein CTM90_01285 [Photobacterium damselae]